MTSDSDSSLISVHQKGELEKEAEVKIVEAGVTDVRFFLLLSISLLPLFRLILKQNKIQFCNVSNIMYIKTIVNQITVKMKIEAPFGVPQITTLVEPYGEI